MQLKAFFKNARSGLVALLLAAYLASPHALHAQGITLVIKNESLDKVFKKIQALTDYRFAYTKEQIQQTSKVSFTTDQASILSVLDLCFKDQPLTYTIENKYILVRQKNPVPSAATGHEEPGILTGKVINESGQPVESATVTESSFHKMTLTDASGEFRFTAILANARLTITCVGYEPQTIDIQSNAQVLIRLKIAVSGLDKAVVIAYGTTTQRLNTGNVTSVTAEEIAKQPVSNPLAALEGRVPGMTVTQNTGVPGGSFTVQIRGQNSIVNGNEPLYIVDGVPFSTTLNITGGILNGGSPLNYISPSDIESIEILKDADATAIYGSRGANGVILITTKKGKEGAMRINVNAYTGLQQVARNMKLLSGPEYLQMRHEAFANDGASPDPNVDVDLLQWDTTRTTDWQKKLIGLTAQTTKAQLTLSGGNANTTYLIGGGYHHETTVFPGDFGDKKASAHFNISNTSVSRKFTATFSGIYTSDHNTLPQTDFTSFALSLPPDAPPVYRPDGSLNWPAGFNNPYALIQQQYLGNASNLIGNAVLGYEIAQGLKVKANAGYTTVELQETTPIPVTSLNPAYGITTGSSTFAKSTTQTWIAEPQLEYDHHFGKHQLKILIGETFQQTHNDNQALYASGYTSDALLKTFSGAANIILVGSAISKYSYNAVFARINYSFNQKYILDLTGRRDGSSRFGPGRQFANFGAVGAAWLFSSENFIKRLLPAISFGKIRMSYGRTGNDQIGDYQYVTTWRPTYYAYMGITGLSPTRLFNPNYSWETNRKLEAGLEVGFFKDRLRASFSYFRNRSSNQLVGYPLPAITGFTSIQSNLGALVQNQALEIEVHTINIKAKEFSWQSGFNLTLPRNNLLDFPNLAISNYANTYVIGKPLSVVQGYHFTGVDPATGVYTYQDVNKDGQISYPGDLTSHKSISKNYYGGLQNSFSFHRFRLDFFIQFVKQEGYNYLYGTYISPGMLGNQPEAVLQRWRQPGDKASVQQFTQNFGSAAYQGYSNVSFSDQAISDASFIRLKNVSISYDLAQAFLQKMHIQQWRFYLQGQNIFTRTKYLGMDPENQSISGSIPPLRVLTAGFDLTF